jgi:outer membrane protein, heavy metal efflux system
MMKTNSAAPRRNPGKSCAALILLFLISGAGIALQAASSVPTNQAEISNDPVEVNAAYVSGLSDEVRRSNPSIKAAEARTNAAFASLGSVKTWEDPRVRLGGMAAREMMRAEEGDIIYGAEQTLPLFGRPAAARRVARAELQVENASLELRYQELRAELAKTLFRAALADETVRTAEQDLGWLEAVASGVETRYQTGQATLLEMLESRNAIGEVRTQLETGREELGHWHLALNRLLNRELQSPWPGLRLPELGPAVEFNSNLVRIALKFEPRALMMKEDIRRGNAVLEDTRRKRFPEVMAGVESRNYSGNGDYRQGMLFLSMSVPWLNAGKYRNETRRDSEKLRELEYGLQDYQLALQEEIHDLTVKASAARRRALLYKDEIIPRSLTSLDSTRAAWETGRASFTELLTTRRILLDARLRFHRSVTEQYLALSELVLCCGLGDLGALEMLSDPDFEPGSTGGKSASDPPQ